MLTDGVSTITLGWSAFGDVAGQSSFSNVGATMPQSARQSAFGLSDAAGIGDFPAAGRELTKAPALCDTITSTQRGILEH